MESFVPVDEQGFWIVGFVSRPVQDVYAMISNLGQMKMLKDEYRNGYCSSLPYFYNYTISDILENGKFQLNEVQILSRHFLFVLQQTKRVNITWRLLCS